MHGRALHWLAFTGLMVAFALFWGFVQLGMILVGCGADPSDAALIVCDARRTQIERSLILLGLSVPVTAWLAERRWRWSGSAVFAGGSILLWLSAML